MYDNHSIIREIIILILKNTFALLTLVFGVYQLPFCTLTNVNPVINYTWNEASTMLILL